MHKTRKLLAFITKSLFPLVNTNPRIRINRPENLNHIFFRHADTPQRERITAKTMQKDSRAFSKNPFFVVINEQGVIILRNITDQVLTVTAATVLQFAYINKLIVVFLVPAQIHGVGQFCVGNKRARIIFCSKRHQETKISCGRPRITFTDFINSVFP